MNDTCTIIDASASGEVRFSTSVAGMLRSDGPSVYRATEFPTFTDALMRFQGDSGIDLRRTPGVLAIGGAVTDGTIAVARSQWTITRAGLTAMFGRPPLIVNDVVARAWATRRSDATLRMIRGPTDAKPPRSGRSILLTMEDGIGCGIVDIDDDYGIRVIDTEGGHTDFAPGDASEDVLAQGLRSLGSLPSWEQVLLLDADHEIVRRAWPHTTTAERHGRIASMVGRYAVNMAMAAGAWNGVLLAGVRVEPLIAGDGARRIDAEFRRRRHYRRLIELTPCWRVEQVDPVLKGAAELLHDRTRRGGAAAVGTAG